MASTTQNAAVGSVGGLAASPFTAKTGKDYAQTGAAGAGAAVGGTLGSALGPLGTVGGAALGGLVGSYVAEPVMKAFGYKSSSSKKRARSANAYNAYQKNALDLLNKQYAIGEDNSDLLDGYRQFLLDKYNGQQKYFYTNKEQDLLDKYLGQVTDQNRAALQRQYNSNFTDNYLDNYWNDTSDDAYINDYLTNQKSIAQNQLDTAKSRGLLNESGYNNAQNLLNRRESAARGEIGALTSDVINSNRDALNTIANNYQSSIDNYDLSKRFDDINGNYMNTFNNKFADQSANLSSSFDNALSGYTPFDVSSILAEARNTQGVLNPQFNNSELLDTLKDKEISGKNKVGLGNQGIF